MAAGLGIAEKARILRHGPAPSHSFCWSGDNGFNMAARIRGQEMQAPTSFGKTMRNACCDAQLSIVAVLRHNEPAWMWELVLANRAMVKTVIQITDVDGPSLVRIAADF